jgi:hypothetical protein
VNMNMVLVAFLTCSAFSSISEAESRFQDKPSVVDPAIASLQATGSAVVCESADMGLYSTSYAESKMNQKLILLSQKVKIKVRQFSATGNGANADISLCALVDKVD